MSKWHIIEHFCQSKTGHESDNEDGFLITDSFIAVVDGATDKNDSPRTQARGGKLLKDLILDTVAKFPPDINCDRAVRTIQAAIGEKYPAREIGHAAASALIYSAARREIWSVGDCRLRLHDAYISNEKEIDIVFARARSIAIHALKQAGTPEEALLEEDLARALILPLLKLQRNLENQNAPYGYCVFNNETESAAFPMDMVRIFAVQPQDQVILASDGYPQLLPTLHESEAALQAALAEDPLCYKGNIGTKAIAKGNLSFDDRTYVRFIAR